MNPIKYRSVAMRMSCKDSRVRLYLYKCLNTHDVYAPVYEGAGSIYSCTGPVIGCTQCVYVVCLCSHTYIFVNVLGIRICTYVCMYVCTYHTQYICTMYACMYVHIYYLCIVVVPFKQDVCTYHVECLYHICIYLSPLQVISFLLSFLQSDFPFLLKGTSLGMKSFRFLLKLPAFLMYVPYICMNQCNVF